MVIYEAFVEGKLEAPKHLARSAHDLYFEPVRGIPSANDLEPLECVHVRIQRAGAPNFMATAKLGEFLEVRFRKPFKEAGGAGRPAPQIYNPTTP